LIIIIVVVVIVIIVVVSVVLVVSLSSKSPKNSDGDGEKDNKDGDYGDLIDSEIDYTESQKRIINPERGFYVPLLTKLRLQGNRGLTEEDIVDAVSNYGLLHLRMGLEAFSSGAGGTSVELTENALRALSDSLSQIRNSGGMAIIRFSYDADGDSYGRKSDPEPEMTLIERHIEQLGGALLPYADVIAGIETGVGDVLLIVYGFHSYSVDSFVYIYVHICMCIYILSFVHLFFRYVWSVGRTAYVFSLRRPPQLFSSS
jgi:hypothetical protein